MKKVKAMIYEYNGGRYGRTGKYIAMITPKYFKNGNLKKGDFIEHDVVEIIQKGYNYGNAKSSKSIQYIIEDQGGAIMYGINYKRISKQEQKEKAKAKAKARRKLIKKAML